MAVIRIWLVGRKTYLLAGAILLVLIGLLVTGHLTPTTALSLVVVASALFPVTIRAAVLAAVQRHHDQLVAGLTAAAAAGAALAVHDMSAAQRLGLQAIQAGVAIGREIQAEDETALQTGEVAGK